MWETLESYARTQVQAVIQLLLEDEVTELLGRVKSERRVDDLVSSRNCTALRGDGTSCSDDQNGKAEPPHLLYYPRGMTRD